MVTGREPSRSITPAARQILTKIRLRHRIKFGIKQARTKHRPNAREVSSDERPRSKMSLKTEPHPPLGFPVGPRIDANLQKPRRFTRRTKSTTETMALSPQTSPGK